VVAPLTDLGARALRARAYLLGHDLATAETLARSLLVEDPGDVPTMTLLARIAFARGDTAGGLVWLRRALDRDPYDAEARAWLDHLDKP
jgi:cytochrome c-type biogenesis protein CcmH/NrfG